MRTTFWNVLRTNVTKTLHSNYLSFHFFFTGPFQNLGKLSSPVSYFSIQWKKINNFFVYPNTKICQIQNTNFRARTRAKKKQCVNKHQTNIHYTMITFREVSPTFLTPKNSNNKNDKIYKKNHSFIVQNDIVYSLSFFLLKFFDKQQHRNVRSNVSKSK
eukprot:TRINITY_DN12141_c0_g2_i1.p1 TRINITY_DN12141_c0_g2~~TRINITY_DN12141_c0_g2_i1.p1  ORF type:complete len:159 (+),score=2.06 TRINITY_DN12141_c0_g2_i1:105-581(+)